MKKFVFGLPVMFVFGFCLNVSAQPVTPFDEFKRTFFDVLDEKDTLAQAQVQYDNAELALRAKLAYLSTNPRKDPIQVVASATAKKDKAAAFSEQAKANFRKAVNRHNDATKRLVQ